MNIRRCLHFIFPLSRRTVELQGHCQLSLLWLGGHSLRPTLTLRGQRARLGQIKLNDARKLDLCTNGFRCAPMQNEHNAVKGSPPPHHSTGKRPVKTAKRQIKVAGKHVVRRGKTGTKGTDVAHYTRMEPTNSIEGK